MIFNGCYVVLMDRAAISCACFMLLAAYTKKQKTRVKGALQL